MQDRWLVTKRAIVVRLTLLLIGQGLRLGVPVYEVCARWSRPFLGNKFAVPLLQNISALVYVGGYCQPVHRVRVLR